MSTKAPRWIFVEQLCLSLKVLLGGDTCVFLLYPPPPPTLAPVPALCHLHVGTQRKQRKSSFVLAPHHPQSWQPLIHSSPGTDLAPLITCYVTSAWPLACLLVKCHHSVHQPGYGWDQVH
jgi:hypothetical protein